MASSSSHPTAFSILSAANCEAAAQGILPTAGHGCGQWLAIACQYAMRVFQQRQTTPFIFNEGAHQVSLLMLHPFLVVIDETCRLPGIVTRYTHMLLTCQEICIFTLF